MYAAPLGTTADARTTSSTADSTIVSLLKGLVHLLSGTGQLNPTARAGAATHLHAPAANTIAVVTLAATPGSGHAIGLVVAAFSATPAAGAVLTIAEGATTVFHAYIPAAGPHTIPFHAPLLGAAGAAVVVTLTAGGAGVSGSLSVHSWTE